MRRMIGVNTKVEGMDRDKWGLCVSYSAVPHISNKDIRV
jgi:hypothetical protein